MSIETRHLRCFLAVADTLHFGRAAERLHLAQPAVSKAVRQLESELGVQLLTRSTRSVSLTPAGEVYAERALAITGLIDQAGAAARDTADGRTGTLRLGVTGSASYGFLPELARVAAATMPDVRLRVRTEMLTPDQERALLADELDLGVLRTPVASPCLEHLVIRSERLVLALPAGHRLAGTRQTAGSRQTSGARKTTVPTAADSLPESHDTLPESHDTQPESHDTVLDSPIHLADLARETFVTYGDDTGSVVLRVVLDACHEAGFVPYRPHQVSETATAVALVAAGLGVALLPESAAALALDGVVFRPVDSNHRVDLSLAWPAESRRPAVTRLVEALRAEGLARPRADGPISSTTAATTTSTRAAATRAAGTRAAGTHTGSTHTSTHTEEAS